MLNRKDEYQINIILFVTTSGWLDPMINYIVIKCLRSNKNINVKYLIKYTVMYE